MDTDIVKRSQIVKPNDRFFTILRSSDVNKGGLPSELGTRLLALDPGETTGVAYWQPDRRTILLQQWETKNLGLSFLHLRDVIQSGIAQLYYEDYKVYDHKARDHVNNSLHTAQWIGGIRICSFLHGVPVTCLMASQGKAFWSDDKLKMCDVYSPGMQHARDACRHLLHHLLIAGSIS